MNDSERYKKIFLFLLSFKWCSQNEFVSQFICLPICINVSVYSLISMQKYTGHVLT